MLKKVSSHDPTLYMDVPARIAHLSQFVKGGSEES